jgi:hypothetical protein
LDRICDTLIFGFHIKDLDFLKVAWAIYRNIFSRKANLFSRVCLEELNTGDRNNIIF